MLAKKEPLASIGATSDDVLNSIVEAIVITDLKGRLLWGNKSAYRMFSVTKGEAIGKPVSRFVIKRDFLKVKKEFIKGIYKGFTTNIDVTALAGNGREFPIRVNGGFLKDKNGKPVGAVLVISDITELRDKNHEAAKLASAVEREKIRAQEAEKARRTVEKKVAALESTRRELKGNIHDLRRLMQVLMGREKKVIEQAEEYKKLNLKLREVLKKEGRKS